jgi:hypothetical protein
MPAIDLARLKTQSAHLAENFGNHMAFLHEFHEFLEFYTNRTIRPSQIAKRLSLPTFNTPLPVLHQIEQELIPYADRFPHKGIILARELWKDGYLESRLLAAHLIGIMPPSEAMPLLTRLPEWLAQSSDKVMSKTLLTSPFNRIRKENLDAFFILLEEWLRSPLSSMQIWGMTALMPVLNDPSFYNLPSVFRILRPTIIAAGPLTQMELQKSITAMEKLSVNETIFYLREIITSNPPALFLRTFRRMLPAFSRKLQSALSEQLRTSLG